MNRLFEDQYNDELSPIIKWPGGKEREIKYILPAAPERFTDYYEPFVGGGAVFTSFNAEHYYINDKSDELIGLYRAIATQDRAFLAYSESIITSWQKMRDLMKRHSELIDLYIRFRNRTLSESETKAEISSFLSENKEELMSVLPADFCWHQAIYERELQINLCRKIARMRKIELEKQILPAGDIYDNIETALLSSLYMYFRELYNDTELGSKNPALGTALFTFIRNYAYSGMFRYNADGEFNVPYGGIAYNSKSLARSMKYYQSPQLQQHFVSTTITCLDFADFLSKYPPQEDDFVFLDPPYDSDFSTYAQNNFTRQDQERLAKILTEECRAKWMLVIKYTDFIFSLYSDKNLKIKMFDKTYTVSFMNRNNKKAEHLVIMNY